MCLRVSFILLLFLKASEEDKDEPLDVSWPNSWRKRITYIALAPIIFPLWLTLPDVRRPVSKKRIPLQVFSSDLKDLILFFWFIVSKVKSDFFSCSSVYLFLSSIQKTRTFFS